MTVCVAPMAGPAVAAGPLGWVFLALVVVGSAVAVTMKIHADEVKKENEKLREQVVELQATIDEQIAAETRVLRFTRVLVSAALADSRVVNKVESDFISDEVFGYSKHMVREGFQTKIAAVLDEDVFITQAAMEWAELSKEHQVMCRKWMAALMSVDMPDQQGMNAAESEWLQEFDRRIDRNAEAA